MTPEQKKRFKTYCSDRIDEIESEISDLQIQKLEYQMMDYDQYTKLITREVINDDTATQEFLIVSAPEGEDPDVYPVDGVLLPAHPADPEFRCFYTRYLDMYKVSHVDSGYAIRPLQEVDPLKILEAFDEWITGPTTKSERDKVINDTKNLIESNGLIYPVNRIIED